MCFSRPLRVCWCFLWKAGTGGPRQQNSRPFMLFWWGSGVWNEREINRQREGDVALCVWSLSVLVRQSDVKVCVFFPFKPIPLFSSLYLIFLRSPYILLPSALSFLTSLDYTKNVCITGKACHQRMYYSISPLEENAATNGCDISIFPRPCQTISQIRNRSSYSGGSLMKNWIRFLPRSG